MKFEIEEKVEHFKKTIYVIKNIEAKDRAEAIKIEEKEMDRINNTYKGIKILGYAFCDEIILASKR
ncbi:MAG: hypothetical protein IKF82_01420 [Bacilli bacterium]|nr:hypothetical protein [Bacilli bacterium]